MSSPAAVQQFDLITDDPRVDSEPGLIAELSEYLRAARDLRGLMTQSQAKRILQVPSGQISTWITRGRLSSRMVVGVRMVSAAEVVALLKERQHEIRKSGGRGVKAPSLAELAQAAWEDMAQDI